MCTVLLRWRPTAAWPVLLGAVRDEFLARPWDPPGAHWPEQPGVLGGRDRLSGGTWLAVDPAARTVAAILNGPPLPPQDRPSRGALPLAALRTADPVPLDIDSYDAFHLLRASPARAELWSWDGRSLLHRLLDEGDHIVVNLGLDSTADPLVPHFAPLLAAVPDPPLPAAQPHPPLPAAQPHPPLPAAVPDPPLAGADPAVDATVATARAWGSWVELLRGDGLDPADPRALIIAHEHDGRRYGSGSASLVGLAGHGVRYDFTAHPATPDWHPVPVA